MNLNATLTSLALAVLLSGCVTPATNPQESSKSPNPDAQVTVKQFVEAHQVVVGSLDQIQKSNKKIQQNLEEFRAEARQSLLAIEGIASQQGTGEITVFFNMGSANLSNSSLEHERLVRFADFLSRESRGRKIIFLSIGSASAIGNHKINMALAKKRAELPLQILDKYLINIPHEFHKVYGTGDLNSPKQVKLNEHQRYQHTRIIALFDTEKAPSNINPEKSE